MPVITLPTSSTSNWGEAYNTAINAINTATDNNTSDIADIETALAGKSNTNHTHSNYATTTELDALETVVNGKADDTHLHTIADITDLTALVASVAGTPTIAVTGLDKDNSSVFAIASHNTTAPLLIYEFEFVFGTVGGTNETYTPKPLANQIAIPKPATTWAGWSVNNDCSLTIKCRVKNALSTSVSTQASITVTCKQFTPITVQDLASEILSNSTSVSTLVDGLASKVLVEVSAIQSA